MRIQFRLRTLMLTALVVGLISYFLAPTILEMLDPPAPEQQPYRVHGGVI